MLAPARRSIRAPAAKVPRRLTVIADGNPQNVKRYHYRVDIAPRAVVPGTRVPVIVLVNPVHAVVKEVVALNIRRIVDRIARYRDQFRKERQVDPDAHVW